GLKKPSAKAIAEPTMIPDTDKGSVLGRAASMSVLSFVIQFLKCFFNFNAFTIFIRSHKDIFKAQGYHFFSKQVSIFQIGEITKSVFVKILIFIMVDIF